MSYSTKKLCFILTVRAEHCKAVKTRVLSSRVKFKFVEKVRQSFFEADTDNTGYLDISEFTTFMRRTYPDISNREAQIIFMKVRILRNEK